MIISKSNVSHLANIIVSPDSATQDVKVMTDGDFSSTYIDALQDETVITFNFAEPQNIEYVAFGGSNVSQKDSVKIETSSGLFCVDESLSSVDAETLFFTKQLGEHYAVTTVTITVKGSGQLAITEIAMGQIYVVPHGGEQAGYNRAWTVPNLKVRSATNLNGAPINATRESATISCTLSVKNYVMADYDKDWKPMLNFVNNNTFYVREDDVPSHSYAGFNVTNASTKAHSSTRLLGDLSMTFNANAKSVLV